MLGFDRMWINQPSTLQEFHQYSCKPVLAFDLGNGFSRVCFVFKYELLCLTVPNLALSVGWANRIPPHDWHKEMNARLEEEIMTFLVANYAISNYKIRQ